MPGTSVNVPSPLLMKEMIRFAFQAPGTAHYTFTTEFAEAITWSGWEVIHVPVNVARNEKIQPAISVVIAKTGPGRPVT